MPLGLTLLPLVSLSAVLLAVGALLCAAVVVLSARSILRPPRMNDGKALFLLRRLSPEDVGLRYEATSFTVRDDRSGDPLKIAAWWIPAAAETDRCVVLLHGYADAKVGAIAWAPVWHALGFHILAPDLRAHGESGGVLCTAGDGERHDVAQVLDQLRAERPAQTGRVVLFGVSLGAAVALAVAADAAVDQHAPAPPSGNGDPHPPAPAAGQVSAVVLESPFADFARAATAHMDRLGVPAGPGEVLHRWAVKLAERWSGADFASVRPVDLLARAPVPVMAILPADDPYLPPDEVTRFESALAARPAAWGPDACWRAEAGHLMAVVADPGEYRRRLGEFLGAALGRTAGTTGFAPEAAPGAPRQVTS